jgi:hypothetical protein
MRHQGYTLLEVVAASALSGTVLVASLSLLRESVDLSDRVDRQNLLETLCVSKLEESLNTTAATFATSDTSGNFAAEGFASIRYRVVATDLPASGGISNRLMAVTCTTWHDANGDTVVSTGEAAVTMATKVAKMALYTEAAGG